MPSIPSPSLRPGHPARCRPARPARPQGARGFTLIELLVALAIVVTLSVLAAPSLSNMLRVNRTAAEANRFVADLQFARSEALQRGQSVVICPSSNGTSCLTTNTWHSGWIAFVDVNGNGTLDSASEPVVRRAVAFSGTDTLVATPSTTSLVFNREGFTGGLTASVSLKVATSPAYNAAKRCITIARTGRQKVVNYDGSSCT